MIYRSIFIKKLHENMWKECVIHIYDNREVVSLFIGHIGHGNRALLLVN